MQKNRSPFPTKSLKFFQVFWVFFAIFAVTFTLFIGAAVSRNLELPASIQYLGTLTPNRSITVVELPASLPLQSVLVEPGDIIEAGQTVALLDTDLMIAKLRQLERQIKVSGILRECLLNTNSTNSAVDSNLLKNNEQVEETDTETEIQKRAALAECDILAKSNAQEIGQLEGAAALLRKRIDLLNQKLAMILSASTVMSPEKQLSRNVLRAHASLDVLLQRNALSQQVQNIIAERDLLRSTRDKTRLKRISDLSEEISKNLLLQELFFTYIANPRLHAPESGTISRIRPILAGTFYQASENLMELRGANKDLFSAEIEMKDVQSATLLPGTAVSLRLLGFTDKGPALHGEISHFVRSELTLEDDIVVAMIKLSDESQQLLADPKNGIALRGRSTASAIRVSQEPKSLWKHSQAVFSKFLENSTVFSFL